MVECKVVLWDDVEFEQFAAFMRDVKDSREKRQREEWEAMRPQADRAAQPFVETTDEQNETVVVPAAVIADTMDSDESAAFVHFEEPAAEPTPTVTHPPCDLAEATQLATQYVTKHGVEKTRAIIAQFGGPRVPNIAPEQLPAFAAALREGL